MSEETIPAWAKEIIRDLATLDEQVPTHVRWAEQLFEDIELRVRALERARWQTAWITAVASAALTAVVVFFIDSMLKG